MTTPIRYLAAVPCTTCGGKGWIGGLEQAAAGLWPEHCGACSGRGEVSVGRIAKEAGCDRRTIYRLDERGKVRGGPAGRILGALARLGLIR